MIARQLIRNVTWDCLQYLSTLHDLRPIYQPREFGLCVVPNVLRVVYLPSAPRVFHEVGCFRVFVDGGLDFTIYPDSWFLTESQAPLDNSASALDNSVGAADYGYRVFLHRCYVQFKRNILRREQSLLAKHAELKRQDETHRIGLVYRLERFIEHLRGYTESAMIALNDKPTLAMIRYIDDELHGALRMLQLDKTFNALELLVRLWMRIQLIMTNRRGLYVYLRDLALRMQRTDRLLFCSVAAYLRGRSRKVLLTEVNLGFRYSDKTDTLWVDGDDVDQYLPICFNLGFSYLAACELVDEILCMELEHVGEAATDVGVLVSPRSKIVS